MKFDEIKKAMDQQKGGDLNLPKSMRKLKRSQLPIERIRKTMMSEIITQLIIVVVFFCVPLFHKMYDQPKAMYLILMFVVCTMTVGYVLKMWGFYWRTNELQINSKDSIQAFIFDLKILLETYKTAVVAGSILLPLPIAALILGTKEYLLKYYHQLFSLDFNVSQLLLLVFGYLFLVAIFYYGTVKWAEWLYGSQIEKLEGLLVEYNESDEEQIN